MTVQNLPLGNGHFDLTGGPCSGCGDCFPGTRVFRVFFCQLPCSFLRQFQRPEDQRTAIYLRNQLTQIIQKQAVFGKEDLILTFGLSLYLRKPHGKLPPVFLYCTMEATIYNPLNNPKGLCDILISIKGERKCITLIC